jgi:hypothetical protein
MAYADDVVIMGRRLQDVKVQGWADKFCLYFNRK